jgi:oligoribonuclease (3'-5' exoribonuclease)
VTALLVADIESTGLDPTTLTVLEVAWCVTGMDGTQRCPM